MILFKILLKTTVSYECIVTPLHVLLQSCSALSPLHTGRVRLCAVRPLADGQALQRAGRGPGRAAAPAALQVRAERGRVQAVDDGVAAGVQVPEDEEKVVHVLGRDPQHLGLEPVPDPQQVIRRPAHHEGKHDNQGHLQGLHPSFRDDVCAATPETRFARYRIIDYK